MRDDLPTMIQAWLHQWWPALVLALVIYWGLKFIAKRNRGKGRLDVVDLSLHEIQTTLACSEQQAKQLLAAYGGNSAKAIHEVKTGQAVLPGTEVSDMAKFGGEVKSLSLQDQCLVILTQDGRSEQMSRGSVGFLFLGVVDASQRPDERGYGRADRGKSYGQLFWQEGETWTRFLLNSSRMDYFDLGERKENSAIRNFRVILQDFRSTSGLKMPESFSEFEANLRLPLYKTLAEFEASASSKLQNGNTP